MVLIFLCLCAPGLRAQSDRCAICGGPFGEWIYTVTDKVTREKKQICHTCSVWPDTCFICGLPTRKDFVKLPDDRFICARDAKTAVLDEAEARRICAEVKEALDRNFSRFVSFPETNVDVAIVDRVNLLANFKVPGNDFECPNVLGYIHPETNAGGLQFEMSLMSALPRAQFKATCAHEYSHAWVFENVPPARRKTLAKDAHEGFCELVAYLLMGSLGEEAEKKEILQNGYTRGQIDLFIQAEQRYGFNEIVEWMKYGVDAKLSAANLNRVRNVEMPRPAPTPATAFKLYSAPPPQSPAKNTLVLSGISSGKAGRLALINDQTLGVGESGKVRVGKTNVLVHCLAIEKDSVRIRVEGRSEQTLRLKPEK